MSTSKLEQLTGTRDEAVRKATGKGWREWVDLLDGIGAPAMGHAAIARYLNEEMGLSGWWSQSVTVGYERIRGLRVKYQACDGVFQASCSKTIVAPAAAVFAAWTEPDLRAAWLPEAAITFRKATPCKSLRITWEADGTHLDVLFYPKGDAKVQVSLQHSRLAGPEQVEAMKSFWGAALQRLKSQLEVTG